jgi:branched-chain amino acid transport system substrate-binding protein
MRVKKVKGTMLLGSLIVCFCFGLFTAVSINAQDKTFTIGLVDPFSGRGADYGRMQKMGVELALAEINSRGGVRGVKFNYKMEDDKMDNKEAANIAKKFVADKEVKVVIGSINTPTVFAAAPIYERGKLTYIVSWASHPDIPKQGKYIFQNDLNMDYEPVAAARYAINNLGLKRLAFMHINDDWGAVVRDRFPPAVEKLGGKVVAIEAYQPGEIDFRNLIIKVVDKKPEALYLAFLAPEAGQLVRQAKELKVFFPIYASSAIGTKTFIELGGSAAEGTVIMSGFNEGDPDPVVQNFVKNFKAKFNEIPSGFSAYPYDSCYLIAEAVKNIKGEVTRDSLRDALENLKNVRLIVGTVSSVNRYFAPRRVVATIVKGNSFVFHQNIK